MLEAGALRWQIADLLSARVNQIARDAVVTLRRQGGTDETWGQFATAFATLTANAVRTGDCDPRSDAVRELAHFAGSLPLTSDQVFSFAFQLMTSSVNVVAGDGQLRVITQRWAEVAHAIRRGVFDVLAAWTTRHREVTLHSSTTDDLTALNTRSMLDVALAKELQRAGRVEEWVSVVLFDVDALGEINRQHGNGVGNSVLETVSSVIRRYVRHSDWVARYGDDSVAVLLPETGPAAAVSLTGKIRETIHERVSFHDDRTGERVEVTASAGVASIRPARRAPIDAGSFLQHAEAALERAQARGSNSTEYVEISASVG